MSIHYNWIIESLYCACSIWRSSHAHYKLPQDRASWCSNETQVQTSVDLRSRLNNKKKAIALTSYKFMLPQSPVEYSLNPRETTCTIDCCLGSPVLSSNFGTSLADSKQRNDQRNGQTNSILNSFILFIYFFYLNFFLFFFIKTTVIYFTILFLTWFTYFTQHFAAACLTRPSSSFRDENTTSFSNRSWILRY
jgi:hypothetical protein